MPNFINIWDTDGANQRCSDCGKRIYSFDELTNHRCEVKVPRVYERQCVYCQAMAVLNDYCRQCASFNPKVTNASSEQTTTKSTASDSLSEWAGDSQDRESTKPST